jgi:hypothetical protein
MRDDDGAKIGFAMWAIGGAALLIYVCYFRGIMTLCNIWFGHNTKVLVGAELGGLIISIMLVVVIWREELEDVSAFFLLFWGIPAIIGAIDVYSIIYDTAVSYIIGVVIRNNLFPIAYGFVFFLSSAAALVAYRMRCKHRLIYGVIELIFGVISIFFFSRGYIQNAIEAYSHPHLGGQESPNFELTALQFIGGVYIVIRGLNNIEDSFKKAKADLGVLPKPWARVFYK